MKKKSKKVFIIIILVIIIICFFIKSVFLFSYNLFGVDISPHLIDRISYKYGDYVYKSTNHDIIIQVSIITKMDGCEDYEFYYIDIDKKKLYKFRHFDALCHKVTGNKINYIKKISTNDINLLIDFFNNIGNDNNYFGTISYDITYKNKTIKIDDIDKIKIIDKILK